MSMCHMAGWPLAIPWDNAAAEPCPLSGDNWWVLPCHLGQETLHTGTSPGPPCTSQLKLAPQLCSCKINNYIEESWGFSTFLHFMFYHLFWQNVSHFPWKVPLCIALSVSTCHTPANTDPPNTSFLLWNNVPTIYTTSSQHIQTYPFDFHTSHMHALALTI